MLCLGFALLYASSVPLRTLPLCFLSLMQILFESAPEFPQTSTLFGLDKILIYAMLSWRELSTPAPLSALRPACLTRSRYQVLSLVLSATYELPNLQPICLHDLTNCPLPPSPNGIDYSTKARVFPVGTGTQRPRKTRHSENEGGRRWRPKVAATKAKRPARGIAAGL